MATKTESKREILLSLLKKIPLKDAGIKKQKSSLAKESSMSGEDYPTLYINIKQAPDLKGYEVGDSVNLVIEGKITSHSINEDTSESREKFDIEIKKIGCMAKGE